MEEKKSIKLSLGTVVCLFIIVLLMIGLVGMYLYYNKNNSNIIVGKESEVKINEIGEKEVYKTSEFESIYKSLVDSEYSNLKSFITSDNKIKEIRVSGITIYTEDYLNATGIKLTENNTENKVMGSCVFTVEFEDIEGLALAGSKGNIHAIVGNCLTDEKDFIFDRNTNKIELCTSLYQEENTTPNNDATINNTTSKTFSNDEIKNSIQKYLDLKGAAAGSPEGLLVKLGLTSFGQYTDRTDDNYIKTNIKYSDYKSKMLNYMTEQWFENNYAKSYKNVDGYIYFFDGGATGMNFDVESVNIKGTYSDLNYIANVYNIHMDDSKELEHVEFHIADYNGKCVISYCDY